jgi:hypothetical protein
VFDGAMAVVTGLWLAGGQDIVKIGRATSFPWWGRWWKAVNIIRRVLQRPLLINFIEGVGRPFKIDVIEVVIWLVTVLVVRLGGNGAQREWTECEVQGMQSSHLWHPGGKHSAAAGLEAN